MGINFRKGVANLFTFVRWRYNNRAKLQDVARKTKKLAWRQKQKDRKSIDLFHHYYSLTNSDYSNEPRVSQAGIWRVIVNFFPFDALNTFTTITPVTKSDFMCNKLCGIVI
jgi:hypothetical protein